MRILDDGSNGTLVPGNGISESALDQPNLGQPLSAIDWGFKAPSTINVYFAESKATVVDGISSNPTFTTTEWSEAEIGQAKIAFQNFSDVANVTFKYVDTAAAADFVMFESSDAEDSGILGYWGVGGGTIKYNGADLTLDGWGMFNSVGFGWDGPGLEVGAFGYITLIHEIGHGMGLAHPHDNGGTSNVMNGVSSPFNDYGDFNLNQGVFTTMTYNDGWRTGPQGLTKSSDYGYQGTLMALDIAVLQDTYGANNTFKIGNDTYTMPSANKAGTYYQAIWDKGGTDTIQHTGSAESTIDLRTADLTNTKTGGGYVSFVSGIHGGFTIASGVVIENAKGGSGVDTITGNSAANGLYGNAGMDKLDGGEGGDNLWGGADADVHNGGAGSFVDYARYDDANYGNLTISLANPGINTGAAKGDTYISIEGVVGGVGNDLIYGDGNSNYLFGSNGGDNLWGGAGNVADFFYGGDDAAIDYVRYDDANYGALTISLANPAANTGVAKGDTYNGIEGVVGGVGADLIYGDAKSNYLFGGNGGDNLWGGAGLVADFFYGGDDASIDYVRYDDANYGNLTIRLDVPSANTGVAKGDTYNGIEGLVGGVGNDTVIGNAAANYLFGGGGLDYIDGLGGNDYLNGGAAADRFRMSTALNAATNVDRIADFEHGVDKILLVQAIFAGIGATLDAGEFKIGSAADNNDFILYNPGTGQLFYDAGGNTGAGLVLFATVGIGTVLDAGDFTMV